MHHFCILTFKVSPKLLSQFFLDGTEVRVGINKSVETRQIKWKEQTNNLLGGSFLPIFLKTFLTEDFGL